ncbi:NADPH:quinone reductase, partial [Acinetobacter baumannii]
IRAAAINPVDCKRRDGVFQYNDSEFPTVPCGDMSGVVVEVGEGVTKFKKGDEVYGHIQELMTKPKQCGTLAEYTAAEEHLVVAKPKNLSFEDAAGLAFVLVTAQQAFETAKFAKGQSVFIVGGAGGVGSAAIQLAKHVYGASKVVATTSTAKVGLVKSLGADLVVDYTKQSYEQVAEKFDFVFDTVGDSNKSHVVAKEGAPIIDIAAFPPHPKAQNMMALPGAAKLEKLSEYLESGKVKAVLDP